MTAEQDTTMNTNGMNDDGATLQDLERALPKGMRGLDVIRRAEKGELQSADGRIAMAQYGDPLIITLLENGQLWVMDDVDAGRALREARKFSPAETVALYRLFWQIALADISTMALMLAADRKPGETLDEQVATILDGSRVPDEATLA